MALCLRDAAVKIGAGEAFAYEFQRGAKVADFNLIVHARSGDSTPEQREAAEKAFCQFAAPCVEQARTAAVELRDLRNPPAKNRKYCLICTTDLNSTDRNKGIVFGFIGNYANLTEAAVNLEKINFLSDGLQGRATKQ
jgi:hypothetical protein